LLAVAGWGWGRSTSIWKKKARRPGSVAVTRRLSEEELEASCLGGQRVRPEGGGGSGNQTGKPFTAAATTSHLTLQLVWGRIPEANPEGYRYSWFASATCMAAALDVVLRQEHKAGEKMFVDWAGATIPFMTAWTGQHGRLRCLFRYWEPVLRLRRATRISNGSLDPGDMHALEFLWWSAHLGVPDNTGTESLGLPLRPGSESTYQEFAMHYGMGVVPASPIQTPGQAKVESGGKSVNAGSLVQCPAG